MSNAPQPTFTDEQVVAAIRAAFSPRWDTSLSREEATTHAETYRANLAHYRRHVQRSLDERDYLQAAEKSWGAFTQVIKAIGADHQINTVQSRWALSSSRRTGVPGWTIGPGYGNRAE